MTAPRIRVRKVAFKGLRQFKDVLLDFTHPDTGDALDRICLIGKNGTGKSTILDFLDDYIGSNLIKVNSPELKGRWGVEIEARDRRFIVIGAARGKTVYLECSTRSPTDWTRFLGADATDIVDDLKGLAGSGLELVERATLAEAGVLPRAGADVLVYCPAEAVENHALQIQQVPETTLDAALHLFKQPLGFRHSVSNLTIREMWRILVFYVKKLESDRQAFEMLPHNLEKTKKQLLDEFAASHPSVLDGLAALWDRILAPAGLAFDVKNAQVPVQLTENLRAYVCLRDTGDRVDYGRLSSGIRNFMFRLGHIFLLYFGRDIERGFLLVDEPENSLFPDFLFEIVSIYSQAVSGRGGANTTQAFFATHSPIVAAQFEPWERIILDWSETGDVLARRGVAPLGDDPNDLLRKDFGLAEVLGKEGLDKWAEYQRLRQEIRQAKPANRPDLVERAAVIAREYGFSPTSQ